MSFLNMVCLTMATQVTTGNLVLIGHLTFVGAFVALVVLPVASVAALNPRWISKLPCR
jgi:uncharacterized membrane protein YphA (DoxX/SURF4 family)